MAWDPTLPQPSSKLRLSPGYITANWAALDSALGSSLKLGLEGQSIWLHADSLSGETASLWTIESAVGDTVLAVKGGSVYTTGGTGAGTWQLPDHTLTTSEMPSHSHNLEYAIRSIGTGGSAPRFESGAPFTPVSNTGGGDPHNHGNSWRPAARVGLIINKN